MALGFHAGPEYFREKKNLSLFEFSLGPINVKLRI